METEQSGLREAGEVAEEERISRFSRDRSETASRKKTRGSYRSFKQRVLNKE